MIEKTKIVVVGSGPAGIAAAIELQKAGLPPDVILEKTGHRLHRDI
jgi:thioredoxin reductase